MAETQSIDRQDLQIADTSLEEQRLKDYGLLSDNPKADMSWEKQRAHDNLVIDLPENSTQEALLRGTRNVARQVAQNTFSHIGVNPQGDYEVFLVTPQTLRTHNELDKRKVPYAYHLARERTTQYLWLRAVQMFQQQGVLPMQRARMLASRGLQTLGIEEKSSIWGTDPSEAIDKLVRSWQTNTVRTKRVAGYLDKHTAVVIGSGGVHQEEAPNGSNRVVVPTINAATVLGALGQVRMSEERSKRAKIIAKSVYTLAAVTTVASIGLTACSSGITTGTETPTVVPTAAFIEVAPLSADSLTLDAITKGLDQWNSFNDGTDLITRVGTNIQVMLDASTEQMALLHPYDSATQTVDMNITQVIVSIRAMKAGVEVTVPCLVTYNSAEKALQIRPMEKMSADQNLLEILARSTTNVVFNSGEVLAISINEDGTMGFALEKPGEPPTLLALVDSGAAKPRTNFSADDINAVVHLTSGNPPIASTSTPGAEVTPSPSPTPDANKPADATGNDEQGNYIKPAMDANGQPLVDANKNPVYATWEIYPSGPNGEKITGWFVDHIKNPTVPGGIPYEDQPSLTLKPSAMVTDIKVKDGIKVPYIEHKAGSDSQGGSTYSSNALNVLLARYYAKSVSAISTSDLRDFLNNKFPNDFTISVTDGQGNPHTIYGDEKFTIVLVDPTDIPNPDWKVPNESGPATDILSMTTYDDATHSAIILVANTKPIDQLSPQEFIDTILMPYGNALALPYQSKKALDAHTDYHPDPWGFADMALKGSPPYITLSDSP